MEIAKKVKAERKHTMGWPTPEQWNATPFCFTIDFGHGMVAYYVW